MFLIYHVTSHNHLFNKWSCKFYGCTLDQYSANFGGLDILAMEIKHLIYKVISKDHVFKKIV